MKLLRQAPQGQSGKIRTAEGEVSEPVQIGLAIGRWTSIYCFEEHSGEVRYVGKTVQYLIDRRKAHMWAARRGNTRPLYWWLRKRHATTGFVTRLIEDLPPGQDWESRERFWIRHYRERGDRILNLTDGGEGLAGHKFTTSHREKIAAARRTGATFNCQTCGAEFYRKRSDVAKGHNKFCSRTCSNNRRKI